MISHKVYWPYAGPLTTSKVVVLGPVSAVVLNMACVAYLPAFVGVSSFTSNELPSLLHWTFTVCRVGPAPPCRVADALKSARAVTSTFEQRTCPCTGRTSQAQPDRSNIQLPKCPGTTHNHTNRARAARRDHGTSLP